MESYRFSLGVEVLHRVSTKAVPASSVERSFVPSALSRYWGVKMRWQIIKVTGVNENNMQRYKLSKPRL